MTPCSDDGRTPRLRELAIAAIVEGCRHLDDRDRESTGVTLHPAASSLLATSTSLLQAVEHTLRTPAPDDTHLARLAHELRLDPLEVLAVALAAAVEDQPLIGQALARAQAPWATSRPTLGLLAHAFAETLNLTVSDVLPALLNGAAVKTGLLSVRDASSPLSERSVIVPLPICLALCGHDGAWPGATVGDDEGGRIPLPISTLRQAEAQAFALQNTQRTLVLRTSSIAEGRSVALAIAGVGHTRAVFIDPKNASGIGPWLLLRKLMPVFCCELAPGERAQVPMIPGYRGPVLAVCGQDGLVEAAHGAAAQWVLPVPSRSERRALWTDALGATDDARDLAARLAEGHRHGAGRIACLADLARHHASLNARVVPTADDIMAAAWSGEGTGLDALAQPLRTAIPDDALIVKDDVQRELDALMARCREREHLADELGPSARTRYRPGVRALFSGPSGTGKTLAAGWMATRLSLPLYRVDLASVTSKYIGETEKNLSQLLARAEQSEVILLFDEADSLFGKRTSIGDANDRFANAQTNYLLQRIESYDGIVILTSNSQARFDEAFARRLDVVVEFSTPGPVERRALWESHLGSESAITPSQLNGLSVLVDLNGGQTRNAVFAAAVRARAARRRIAFEDVLAGAEAELRKVGRQISSELVAAR